MLPGPQVCGAPGLSRRKGHRPALRSVLRPGTHPLWTDERGISKQKGSEWLSSIPSQGLWALGPIWKTHREAPGAGRTWSGPKALSPQRGACCCPSRLRLSAQTCPEAPHTRVDLSPTHQDLRVPASERAPGFWWGTHRCRCFASRSSRCCHRSVVSLSAARASRGKDLRKQRTGPLKSHGQIFSPSSSAFLFFYFLGRKSISKNF